MPRLNEREQNWILELYKQGLNMTQISARTGFTRVTVNNWLKKFESEGKIRIVKLPTHFWASSAAEAKASFRKAISAIDPNNPLPKTYQVKERQVKKQKKKVSKTPVAVKVEKREKLHSKKKLIATNQANKFDQPAIKRHVDHAYCKTEEFASKRANLPGSHNVLHGFPHPTKDTERFNSWVFFIGGDILALDNHYIYSHRRVCHAHFEEKYCCRFDRISNIAVPTLNMPGPLLVPDLHEEEQRLRVIQEATPSTSKGNRPSTTKTKGTEVSEDVLLQQPDSSSQEIGDLDDEDDNEKDIFEEIVDYDFQQIPGEAQPATLPAGEFSWQRASAVVPGDADDVAGAEYEMEAEMFEAPAPRARAREQALHEGYRCNGCGGSIVGFRYVCVQCADVDLCGACEAAGQHMRHYALRVPGPRAYDEVAAVLHRVRQALLADSILLGDGLQMEAEVKEEPEEADPIAMSAAANDGDECESVGAASAAESTHALEADTAASDDDDSYAPSEDDSDSDTEAGRSAPGHTVDYSTPTRSQSHHASPSSVRAVKRPAPSPICYFDLRKTAAMIAGDRSKSDMEPAALRRQPATQLHSLPRHEDDTLAVKRPLSAAQVLLDSKQARVTLERLDDAEVHSPRVKR
ncbi:uncharacterized protein LOC126377819 isoform X6 [Pectinophora gossypiella]|uniref:uncharacterized protein LOC126377819 isoform X6 n=1 Tax=Pectinophora gossypiella TaxID=13191 RepID=UPI00214E423F|nr:uncharacterized protein LOC126377819 isoform X6 [Pectinophora gossypiella]